MYLFVFQKFLKRAYMQTAMYMYPCNFLYVCVYRYRDGYVFYVCSRCTLFLPTRFATKVGQAGANQHLRPNGGSPTFRNPLCTKQKTTLLCTREPFDATCVGQLSLSLVFSVCSGTVSSSLLEACPKGPRTQIEGMYPKP